MNIRVTLSLGLLSAVSFAYSAPALAQYGVAGCGLGSILFGNKPGFVQVFAATFNGTFGNQTFGITTGTSNCGEGLKVSSRVQQLDYVTNNRTTLEREAAQGSGESLGAFAATFGCETTVSASFATKMQSSFSAIFAQTSAESVVDASRSAIAADPALAQACRSI
jgi:hypothetical protein